jgi:hypothetical protein
MLGSDINGLRQGDQSITTQKADGLELLLIFGCGQAVTDLSNCSIHPFPSGKFIFLLFPGLNSIQ